MAEHSKGAVPNKRIRVRTLVFALFGVVILVCITSLVVVYGTENDNRIADRLKSVLPYPMVIIDHKRAITFRTLSENMASVKQFYEAQDFAKIGIRIDFTTDEGKRRLAVRQKEVLNKMLEDEAIMLIAKEDGIFVSDENLRQGIERKLSEYGSGDEVKKNLERLYGWTLTDFEEKIVRPSMYQEKLFERFQKEIDVATPGKERIGKAQQALRERGEFEEVAREYSQGRTAADGGKLGWFSLEDLSPELREPVSRQKIGVPGDIIESELGFHIVLIDEVKKESGKNLYSIHQIFTKKVTFADWLSVKMQEMPVYVLSGEYQWNKEHARIEFRNEDMRTFEQKLFEQADENTLFFF